MTVVGFEEVLGRTLAPLRFTVERGKVAEFARATHNANPEYFDAEAESVPAPLTFSVASRLYSTSGDAFASVRELGMDPPRVVHGMQEWVYHRPVRSGQVLEGTPTVTDVYAKTSRGGGEMVFVMLETVFRDVSDNEPVVTERMLSIQLPEKEKA